jgi:4a-hydroxytetrahydrobiopterin dehydratase
MQRSLASRECVPCRGGVPPLTEAAIAPLLAELNQVDPTRPATGGTGGWSVAGAHHLEKTYAFPDFVSALAFTNRVGALAEEQGHHPDIYLTWGRVRLTVWTHKIDGLTESDFVLAAKADQRL